MSTPTTTAGPDSGSFKQTAAKAITVAAVLARAVAYVVRARRTKAAVARMQGRYEDRAASARYLSGGMAVLDVDEPTVTAYGEVAAKGEAAAANLGTVIAAADALVVNGQQLETETRARHGRMQDANRTHSVPMAQSSFIKRQ
ncbi:hypothetical protein ABZ819_05215 [Streptomyces venezuelae]|uniref:hypothetical protein n=1 Tax=Streptomyces venezuelae TaxID=54571 RepID=UPI003421FA92